MAFDDPRTQALLAMGLGTLAGSGPSPVNQGLLPILGQAGIGAMGMYQQLLSQKARQAQLDKDMEFKEREMGMQQQRYDLDASKFLHGIGIDKARTEADMARIDLDRSRLDLDQNRYGLETRKQNYTERQDLEQMQGNKALADSIRGVLGNVQGPMTPQQQVLGAIVSNARDDKTIADAAKNLFPQVDWSVQAAGVLGGRPDDRALYHVPNQPGIAPQPVGTPSWASKSLVDMRDPTKTAKFLQDTKKDFLGEIKPYKELDDHIDQGLLALRDIKNPANQKRLVASLTAINDTGARAIAEIEQQRGPSYGDIYRRATDFLSLAGTGRFSSDTEKQIREALETLRAGYTRKKMRDSMPGYESVIQSLDAPPDKKMEFARSLFGPLYSEYELMLEEELAQRRAMSGGGQ